MKKDEVKEVKKVKEVKEAKVKRVASPEQKAVTMMFRETRKVCFKLLKTIKDSENKEAVLEKVNAVFAETQKKISAIQSEALFFSRFSTMSEEEKNLLRSMLNNK